MMIRSRGMRTGRSDLFSMLVVGEGPKIPLGLLC